MNSCIRSSKDPARAWPLDNSLMARALTTSHALCSKCRPKPRFRSVELTKFGVAEKHTVDVFVHLFQDDLFVAEPFTEEDTTLVPADVSTVVHPSLPC